jgi:hypothetical protein
VADNAPCHSRLAAVFENSDAVLLKLAPYSPMLNPVEQIWSKVKMHVKAHIEVPIVVGRALKEQRLQYLEGLMRDAKNILTARDCGRAVQHSTTFYEAALNLQDMNIGQ